MTERKSSETLASELHEAMNKTPFVSRWEHKEKKIVVRVIGHCVIESTCEIGVMYREKDDNRAIPWVRALANFLERFNRVEGT